MIISIDAENFDKTSLSCLKTLNPLGIEELPQPYKGHL